MIQPNTGNGLTAAGWIQNSAGSARVTTQFDSTTTTLVGAGIPGLSWTLKANRTYSFYIFLIVNASAAGGMTMDLNGGTTSVSTLNANGLALTASSFGGSTNVTTLAGLLVNNLAQYVSMTIVGTIAVGGTGGTFIPRFAQNSAAPSAMSSVLVGSFGWVWDMP